MACSPQRLVSNLSVLLLLLVVAPLLALSCDSPPQILEITPERGAREVRSSEPIRIRFDRRVDTRSVASRFSIRPTVAGHLSWEAPNTLVFRHDTLRANSRYTVSLAAGYRDASGISNSFNHGWSFTTEAPPEIRGSAPASGESQVDPAGYLNLTFSRDMNAASLRDAVSFTPALSFSVRPDPSDSRRLLIAPKSLLDANSEYQLRISSSATDVDGNHLPSATVRFTTGSLRSLTRWITFIASQPGSAAGSAVWMVDQAGFPRILEEGLVDAFNWSPDGSNLLTRHPEGTWTDYAFGSFPVDLPFRGQWAVYLGPDAGYAFLNGTDLSRLLPTGEIIRVATGVTGAAVSHDLTKIAITQPATVGTDVRGYDVALRSQYRIQHESDAVTGLAWAPNGSRLAYVVAAGPTGSDQLRVKALVGSAAVVTVATGQLAEPAWLADSNDVTISARVNVAGVARWRVFRINTSLPVARLTSAGAIGSVAGTDAFMPRPSPDGHQIAFLVGAPESAQAWVMNADGTGLTRITAPDPQSFPYSVTALHWGAP